MTPPLPSIYMNPPVESSGKIKYTQTLFYLLWGTSEIVISKDARLERKENVYIYKKEKEEIKLHS